MDLTNIKCLCKQNFNKQEFKKHFKNCILFKQKYKDFDFTITQLLKKYLCLTENASIIIFLFQRYIKTIKNKFKNNQNKEDILYKFIYEQNSEIDNDNDQQKEDENNFKERLSFDGGLSNNKNKNNPNNQFKNEIRNYNQNNNIINSLIQNYNFGIKNDIFQQNQDAQNIRPIFKGQNNLIYPQNNIKSQIYNNGLEISQPLYNYNMIMIGSNIKYEERNTILDYCKNQYILNNGKFNSKIINNLSYRFKTLFFNDWFILISNKEYNDLYFSLTKTSFERIMIFSLGNLKFHIEGY